MQELHLPTAGINRPTRIGRIAAAGLLAFSCATCSLSVFAETIRLPIGHQSQTWDGSLPKRGTTKSEVESQFGQPQSTDGPTGEPPIYFWEYADFTVYFESDRVIHSVVKHITPAN